MEARSRSESGSPACVEARLQGREWCAVSGACARPQDSVLEYLPLLDEVNKLEPDVDIILSVRRGRAFANSVSYTPLLSSAEL